MAAQKCQQAQGIGGRRTLPVIVEIDTDIAIVALPSGDRPRPFAQRGVGVMAGAARHSKDGKHRVCLEGHGYRWYRAGGLDYLLNRSDR